MDKLAENLQRLQEDDLLQVVQIIHDHKSADSYTKNDIDGTLVDVYNFYIQILIQSFQLESFTSTSIHSRTR